MRPLEGRTALVTGAGKGIGMGIALELAQAGAAVVINYAHSAAGARRVREEIEAAGGEAMVYQADVSQEGEVIAMIEAAHAWRGGLDILVNNAAAQTSIPLLKDYDFQYYRQLVDVNIGGYFMCTREAARLMRPRGKGVIICISSIHARRATQFDMVYGMTKGGIRMMAREAAAEYARDGIRVLCIEPGAVRIDAPKTGNVGNFSIPERQLEEKYIRTENAYQLGRIPVPKDVGQAVVFLAGDAASMITGCEIALDGGATMHI